MMRSHWAAMILIVAVSEQRRVRLCDAAKPTGDLEPKGTDKETTKTTSELNGAKDENRAECGIWLAVSTIPGAGLGMFAGKDFEDGEEFTESGDISIPIVDLDTHSDRRRVPFRFLWDEYVWQAKTLLMDHEGLHFVTGASPGFGAVANSFVNLVNAHDYRPENNLVGLSRKRDPGVGAFSPYHNRKSVAIGSVKAGEELFESYGTTWFMERPKLGPIPVTFDHRNQGTALFREFKRMKHDFDESQSPILDEMWETFVMKSPYRSKSRVLNALPSNLEDMHFAMRHGLVATQRRNHTVTKEWLQNHGTCMDNLRIGPSTIRQAGRGAFATRFLPSGSVVAPLPMIQIPRKSIFLMKGYPTAKSQLLRNYCMGHSESTVLLCPYGLMTAAVNHNQTLANVRLQWSDPQRMPYQAEWLDLTVAELENQSTTGLVMELVATRDIAPGDEIFMDYGDEWQKAWTEHVRLWKPDDRSVEFPTAEDLNANKERNLRTVFEQMDDRYPENVELKCEEAFKYRRLWTQHQREGGDFRSYIETMKEYRAPCDLLHVTMGENGTVLYTAIIPFELNGRTMNGGRLDDVPSDAFVFVDKPYRSEMHLPNAFRHEIMIPDEIFPGAWMNN